jgi:monoamine oxidase
LANELRNAADIRTESPVAKIEIETDRVTIWLKERGTSTLRADYVVLATPPSSWRDIDILGFEKAAGDVGMGPASKYLAVVEDRFWLRTHQTANSVNDRVGQTWEATENQMVVPGGEFVWSVFAGSSAARDPKRHGPDKFYAQRLGGMYRHYRESLRRGEFIDWEEMEWSRSGYSCPAPGEVCTKGKFLNGAVSRRLVFAGEHTSMDFFGYMEGALRSGAAAAKLVTRLARDRQSIRGRRA